MANFSLGKPITISGQEVVVVRDVVLGSLQAEKGADTYSIVEPKGVDGRPAIYVSEDDLDKLREDYPGMKVYGFWQLLFFNNAVPLGEPLALFPLEAKRGLYLLMKNGQPSDSPADIAESGEYVDYIPGQFELDLDKANIINVELKRLKLPSQPAYTRSELSQKLRAENKRRWLVVASLCGLVAVAASAANYGLQTIYKSRMADYSTKRGLIDELGSRVRTLSAERVIKRPDDSVMITQLFKVFDLYPAATTPMFKEGQRTGFTAEHILITPKKATVDPAKVISGLRTELQPDFSYRVIVGPPEGDDRSNNDGVGS